MIHYRLRYSGYNYSKRVQSSLSYLDVPLCWSEAAGALSVFFYPLGFYLKSYKPYLCNLIGNYEPGCNNRESNYRKA